MSNIVRISPAQGNMCNTFDFNGVGTNPTRSGKVLFPPAVPYILYTRKPKMRVGWSNTAACFPPLPFFFYLIRGFSVLCSFKTIYKEN